MTRIFTAEKSGIVSRVQVNIPFSWLMDENADWLEVFIENRINPEIGIDAETLDSFTHADFFDIARRFHSLGRSISIHGPFLDLSAGSTDNAIRSATRQRLAQMSKAAKIFSPATVVCHAGYDATRYGFIKDTWYKQAAETWEWIAGELEKKQIRLMLENVYETRPEEIQHLFAKIKSHDPGCCLDVGHLAVFSPVCLKSWLEILTPYIGQLHLHDNHGQNDEHLGMGEGSIDFTPLFEWLRNVEQMPLITLEPRNEDALVTSISYLEKNWLPRST